MYKKNKFPYITNKPFFIDKRIYDLFNYNNNLSNYSIEDQFKKIEQFESKHGVLAHVGKNHRYFYLNSKKSLNKTGKMFKNCINEFYSKDKTNNFIFLVQKIENNEFEAVFEIYRFEIVQRQFKNKYFDLDPIDLTILINKYEKNFFLCSITQLIVPTITILVVINFVTNIAIFLILLIYFFYQISKYIHDFGKWDKYIELL